MCFDASDLMPGAMANAFYRALLEFVQSPGDLEGILVRLDRVRASVPATDWLDVPWRHGWMMPARPWPRHHQ